MHAVLGWMGAVCLALCGLPQAIKTVRTRKADDISFLFLSLWLGGEVLTLAYVLPSLDFPLMVNYLVNILIVGTIMRFKLKGS